MPEPDAVVPKTKNVDGVKLARFRSGAVCVVIPSLNWVSVKSIVIGTD